VRTVLWLTQAFRDAVTKMPRTVASSGVEKCCASPAGANPQ